MLPAAVREYAKDYGSVFRAPLVARSLSIRQGAAGKEVPLTACEAPSAD